MASPTDVTTAAAADDPDTGLRAIRALRDLTDRLEVRHIFFADASRQALARTVGLVGRRHLGRVDAGHVLFGVLAVADPLVGRLLQQLGTDPHSLREGAAGTDAAWIRPTGWSGPAGPCAARAPGRGR